MRQSNKCEKKCMKCVSASRCGFAIVHHVSLRNESLNLMVSIKLVHNGPKLLESYITIAVNNNFFPAIVQWLLEITNGVLQFRKIRNVHFWKYYHLKIARISVYCMVMKCRCWNYLKQTWLTLCFYKKAAWLQNQ